MTPRFRSWLNRVLLALALALAAALGQAGAAWAHASLNATEPIDGAVVNAAPQVYRLTFSEPVAPLALRLVRPDGSSMALDRFALKGDSVEIEAPAGVGRGTYVLSWRVVSADGHPIGGSVVFSVGEASARSPAIEEGVDWPVRIGLWLGKVALYVGLFVGIGGVFARRILMPEVRAASRIVAAALIVGAAGAIVSLGFQGLDALGAEAGRVAEPAVWSAGFGTSYGRTVIAALAAFALAGAALRGTAMATWAAACAALLLGGVALALSGHASAASPQWLMRPAVFLHAVGIAVWIGALAPLGLALARREAEAVSALARFSRVIPAVVAVLLVAGVVLAVVQVERPSALLSTAYGQVFLIKLALLAGLSLLAAVNRWALTARVEAGDPVATRRLARSIAAETLVVLLIFGAAAAWRFTPPPRALAAAAATPATAHIHTPKAMADLTVTPGRTGTVDVSAVIMSGDFAPLGPREVTFMFSQPNAGIEPFRRKAAKQADGRWIAEEVVLPLPGDWTIRIDVLISDFERAKLDGKIKIKP